MKLTSHDTESFRREWERTERFYRSDEFNMPVRYMFMLTNLCNLHCPFCTMEHVDSKNAMTPADWINVADQLPSYARLVLMGGEPLFYAGFSEVFSYVAERFTTSIITNGTLLDDARIELLLSKPFMNDLGVSIDTIGNDTRGFSQEQWDTLVRGIKLFRKERDKRPQKTKLGVKTVLLDENASGLFDLHRFTREALGCDTNTYGTLAGSTMQLSDRMRPFGEIFETPPTPYFYKNWTIILDQFERIREYDKQHGYKSYFRPKVIDLQTDMPISAMNIIQEPSFDKNRFAACMAPWADCRIYGEGSVTSCLSVRLGNAKQESLRTILTGPAATEFRKLLKDHHMFPQCHRCNYAYTKEFE